MPFMSRPKILRTYAEYDDSSPAEPIAVSYKLFEPLPDVLQKYDYPKYVEGFSQTDDGLAFSLLRFVCDHFRHNGNIRHPKTPGAENTIWHCEQHGAVNCRGLAILLAGLLRMNGMKALHITCMPFEDPFGDCHVVVDCFLPSGKRVMLDPTYRL